MIFAGNMAKAFFQGNKKTCLIFPFLALCLALSGSVQAQITTTPIDGMTPEDVANSLVGGPGVTISNVVLTGPNACAGTFSGGSGIIEFDEGVILGSGNIGNVVGPNTDDGITTAFGLPGDPDLDTLIPGFSTNDACILEFDFIPAGPAIEFQYVFASEEYNEFVNSEFNDVFGFFINGTNQALLPDGVTTVAINNINYGNPYGTEPTSNPDFYRNNDLDDGGGSINIEADGLTLMLELNTTVAAGETNHMKLAIADAGDNVLDSWVFIRAASIVLTEICNNGEDDDADGLVDQDDPDCWICGDGIEDPGEECDDGNIVSGDGCSALCEDEYCGNGGIDPGEDCGEPGLPECPEGQICEVCSCELVAECGNGIIDTGEDCGEPGLPECPEGQICEVCSCELVAECGNGVIDTGEDCGEPGLPDCPLGQNCDTCLCVDEYEQCVYSQGYWKNHNSSGKNPPQQMPWPIAEETVLCGQTWIEILKTPPKKGNAFYILGHQWIAAELNVANGAETAPEVDDALTEAEALLSGCEISKDDRQEALALAFLLDEYNNGLVGPPKCGF